MVNFSEFEEENRKTTIQMTVNVERTQAGYSSGVESKDKVEILIQYYSVLHQLDQKIIYPHYDFKHLTESILKSE